MKIELNRINDMFHFEATNEDGNVVEMDGSTSIGGEGKGVRPMQMLLMGLGGCSGIDIVLILKKQKQVVEDFKMTIDGDRQKDVEPSLFEKINVNFKLKGDLDHNKVRRAVALSMDKYCSVSKTLEKTAEISYSITVNGEDI